MFENIMFVNKEHKEFFVECLKKADSENCCYHKALFYCLGLTKATRNNINALYDFKSHEILQSGLKGGWHTSGSVDVCGMAFNLFNGYIDKNIDISPYEIFSNCEFRQYFIEAVKIRFEDI